MLVAGKVAFMKVSLRANMDATLPTTIFRLSAADQEAVFSRSTTGQQLHLNNPFQVGN